MAVDGSKPGERAFEVALKLARDSGARLEIAHVVGVPVAFAGEAAYVQMEAISRARREAAEKMLAGLREKAAGAGVKAETALLEGHVAGELVKHAEKSRADLLVIGNRGLSNVARFLLGSVSSAVVAQAKCSVVVVK